MKSKLLGSIPSVLGAGSTRFADFNLKNKWMKFLPFGGGKRGQLVASEWVGIEISSEGIGCAVVNSIKDGVKLNSCKFLLNSNVNIRASLLADFVERNELNGKSCNLVLHPDDYKLLLVEAPDVPLEELHATMPNRIKDLIPWSLDQSVTAVIPLPQDAYRGRNHMVYVVASNKQTILQSIALIAQSGLELATIDIQEMALRNISLNAGTNENSYAILRLLEKESILLLMNSGQLYLTRRLSVPIKKLHDPEVNKQEIFNHLVLEVQRSLDYYESQLGKGPVKHLLVLPASIDLGLGVQYMKNNLSPEVEEVSIVDQLNYEGDLSVRDLGFAIPTIGAALREVVVH